MHGKQSFTAILEFLFVLMDKFDLEVDSDGLIGNVKPRQASMYLSLGQGGYLFRRHDGRVTSHGICVIKTLLCILLHGGEIACHSTKEVIIH